MSMKLNNFFYLQDKQIIYTLFRNTFSQQIPARHIEDLVDKCLGAIDQDVVIFEWFLFEELHPVAEGAQEIPGKTFYLMESNERKKYFIKNKPHDKERLSRIGFAAVANPRNMRILIEI